MVKIENHIINPSFTIEKSLYLNGFHAVFPPFNNVEKQNVINGRSFKFKIIGSNLEKLAWQLECTSIRDTGSGTKTCGAKALLIS